MGFVGGPCRAAPGPPFLAGRARTTRRPILSDNPPQASEFRGAQRQISPNSRQGYLPPVPAMRPRMSPRVSHCPADRPRANYITKQALSSLRAQQLQNTAGLAPTTPGQTAPQTTLPAKSHPSRLPPSTATCIRSSIARRSSLPGRPPELQRSPSGQTANTAGAQPQSPPSVVDTPDAETEFGLRRHPSAPLFEQCTPGPSGVPKKQPRQPSHATLCVGTMALSISPVYVCQPGSRVAPTMPHSASRLCPYWCPGRPQQYKCASSARAPPAGRGQAPPAPAPATNKLPSTRTAVQSSAMEQKSSSVRATTAVFRQFSPLHRLEHGMSPGPPQSQRRCFRWAQKKPSDVRRPL